MNLDLNQVIEAMKSAGVDANSILSTVQELQKLEEAKKEQQREKTRLRVQKHRGNVTQCNASNALHDEKSVTPSSPDGFPPYPLSLTTPTLPQKPPKGGKKGFQIPDWIPSHDWEAFVEMRKKIRKPMTEEAMRLAVLELEKLRARGQPPDKVLQQSTMNSWQGLFEMKGGTKTSDSVKKNVKRF